MQTEPEVSSGRSSQFFGEGPNEQESESTEPLTRSCIRSPKHRGQQPRLAVEAARVVVGDETKWVSSEAMNSGTALLEAALTRENMVKGWKRVKANKGSAGVDGMTIRDAVDYLKSHWLRIKESLLDGTYRPAPVRRVMIPKSDGTERQLGIPTVLDRLIEKALLQVLQPQIDPTFSEHSYGFRPKRSAHQAVLKAQEYVQSGRVFVVDVDLETFFDRARHALA